MSPARGSSPLGVVVGAAGLVAATACAEPPSIRLAAESTADRIVFDVEPDPARSITAFRIDACSARGTPPQSHWLTGADSGAGVVRRIEYGTPPKGWHSAQGPRPLTPGCYRAAIANAPPLEFDVRADGSVRRR